MDKTFLRAVVDEVFALGEGFEGSSPLVRLAVHGLHQMALKAVDEFAGQIPDVEALSRLPGAALSYEGFVAEVNALLDLLKAHAPESWGAVVEAVRGFFGHRSQAAFAGLARRGVLTPVA